MATRYKDRITILEDAEIEELYGRPRFTHDERVYYFALTPEERALADGHYSLASRVLFILQAGYFKAKTRFFSFEIDEVADDVKHVLQQHYPQYHDTGVEIGDRQTDPLRATAQTTDSPQFQRNIQRALNRGESYHKLVRAVAYANGGKLRVRTDQEQQLWSECSRLLTNCIIYYNACILSELLERAERRQDYQPTDAIKRANPASWKHVNLYGAYSFLDIGDGVDLQKLVNLLEAARGRDAAAPD